MLSSGYLVYQGGLQAGRQTAASAAATICTHQMQCKADRLKLRVLLERCWNDCCCCRSVSHRVATKASASGSIGAGGNGLPSSCNGRSGHCHCHLPTTILYFRFSLSFSVFFFVCSTSQTRHLIEVSQQQLGTINHVVVVLLMLLMPPLLFVVPKWCRRRRRCRFIDSCSMSAKLFFSSFSSW